MGIAGPGIVQDLANEVHGALYFEGLSLFFSLHHQGRAAHLHGGHNVEQKQFSVGRRIQDRGLCQELFDHVKRLLGLRCPLKAVGFLQELIKGETSFAKARDESAEGGEAPYDPLNPLYVLDWTHPCDG